MKRKTGKSNKGYMEEDKGMWQGRNKIEKLGRESKKPRNPKG